MILIAYDCDRNFEPCFKNGTTAHWTLINGFMLPISEESECSIVEESKDVLMRVNLNRELIYTLNLHGKSKHYGVWNLNQLLKSNSQLRTIGEQRSNSGDYVIPEKSLMETLASRALIIF